MRTYRHNKSARDKHPEKLGGRLPTVRFDYECVWACHLGTDDAAEFGRHLAECPHIQPGVRLVAARFLATGRPVCVEKLDPGEAPGQLDLAGMPPRSRHKRRGIDAVNL